MLKWEDCAIEFVRDGGLREIIINGMTPESWERTYQFIVGQDGAEYSYDNEAQNAPDSSNAIFRNNEGYSCNVRWFVGGIMFALPFFEEDMCTITFDPETIDSQDRLNSLLKFSRSLCEAVDKPLIIIPEGMNNVPIFSFAPRNAQCVYHAPRFGTIMDNGRVMSEPEVFWWLLKLNIRNWFRKK